MAPLPWRRIVLFAVVGTTLCVAAVIENVRQIGNNPLTLIQAASAGPSAGVIKKDFPDAPLPQGIGHDGQQFYAIARQPMHFRAASHSLDRPRYRLQRPLFPWLAWALHPSGGGIGLVHAMFAVGVLSLLGGAIAFGAVAVIVGGPAWMAVVFPILPGSYAAIRLGAADNLALALALAAVGLSMRERQWAAVVAAVAAVLAKESSFLVVAGYAIWRRDREAAWLAAFPAAVAIALATGLQAFIPEAKRQFKEFGLPFVGIAKSIRRWSGGRDHIATVADITALLAAIAALVRTRLRTPFGWAITLHLVLFMVATLDVIGLTYNASRATQPMLLLGVLALIARTPNERVPATAAAA